MDKNEIREICDVVSDQILSVVNEHVHNETSSLKHSIYNQVIHAECIELDHSIHLLLDKSLEMKRRIESMESKLRYFHSCDYLNEVDSLAQRLDTLEKRLILLEKSNSLSMRDGIQNLTYTQLNEIKSSSRNFIEKGGWIYYIKLVRQERRRMDIREQLALDMQRRREEMLGIKKTNRRDESRPLWGELYKVRIDGTENQKIFNGKVKDSVGLKLEGNALYFKDINGNEDSIVI